MYERSILEFFVSLVGFGMVWEEWTYEAEEVEKCY